MSYVHIENLYKATEILLFKECYAMEKIHGTSAHISYNTGQINYFAGGCKQITFEALFNKEQIKQKFIELGKEKVIIYGEAYGGKMQGMRATYGDSLKFIVFEVRIGDCFLSVPETEKIALNFGLEFVYYEKISTDLKVLEEFRNQPSIQTKRNGIFENKEKEGIVLRPLIELRKNNGERIIVKYKNDSFIETKTPREVEVNPERLKIIEDAKLIAQEWVTPMRLNHVLDKFPDFSMEQTGEIIKAMLEDVKREAKGEIIFSKEADKEISKQTVTLLKDLLNNKLKEK